MYFYGDGVGKNLEQAVTWMRKAAEQGYAKAQHQLGVYYRDGIGIPVDPVIAYAWFSAAVNHGFDKAEANLKDIEKNIGAEDLIKAKIIADQYTNDYKIEESK